MEGETAGPTVVGPLFLVLLVSSVVVSFFIGRSQLINIPPSSPRVFGVSTVQASDEFQIANITLGVDSHTKFGCLYKQFNFYGQITSNGKGTVSYGWEGSNNSSLSPILLKFDRAETKYVSTDWQVYGPGVRTMKLHVYSPDDISSPETPFEVTCE